MKKIVYLDIWEKGHRNFARIDEGLKKEGYSTLLIHTGSFYYKNVHTERWIGSMLVRDIQFYHTTLIKKAIQKEHPDVIIMLNLSFVFDRAIVNICKSEGIKLVYLSHGKLISPELVNKEVEKLNSTIWNNLNRVFSRKNFLVLTNYLSSLSGLKLLSNPLKLMYGLLRKPSSYLTFPTYTSELDADLILLYTKEDKALLTNKFGFPENCIKVVGNPEITFFMNAPSLPKVQFLGQIGLNEACSYVVYLDDGMVCDKIITAEQWQGSLSEIAELTKSLGFKLIVKLHPRTNILDYQTFFEKQSIVALKDCDFKNLLEHSEFVVSHVSTTIIYALLFRKNVFVPFWGIFTVIGKNYPEGVVQYSTSKKDFLEKASKNKKANNTAIDKYLQDNGIDPTVNSINLIIREVATIL